MAVPPFQDFFKPILQVLEGKSELSLKQLRDQSADLLGLSEEERAQKLPSGTQHVYENRAGWAVTYLKWAKLVRNTRRGFYAIEPAGVAYNAANPTITEKDLTQDFDAVYDKVKGTSTEDSQSAETASVNIGSSPQDKLDEAFGLIQQDLQDELLEKLKANSPEFFERAVLDVLSGLGYGGGDLGRTEVVGKPGDEGIDGIIREDTLGLEMIYVQAKRWQGSVGRPEVQKFVGAMQGQRAKKGVIITTSAFTAEAHDYADSIDMKVVLLDGDQLTRYMIEKNVGVSTEYSYHIKRLDSDYFEE